MAGKRKVICAVWILAALFLLAGPQVKAAGKEEITISQTDIYMPDMAVYLTPEQKDTVYDASDVKAGLKETDTSLFVHDSERFSDSGKGIYYYVLLDVSTSISKEQFASMKRSVIRLSKTIRKQDRMQVITFGKKVKVLLKGGESSEEVEKQLNALGQEKKTHLYEGINRLSSEVETHRQSEISDKTDSEDFMRHVGVILTDWQEVKDAGGLTSQEESLKQLQKTGTPLYGYCLDSASDKVQDDMGAFLRKTGGEFQIYKAGNENKELTDLNEKLLQENMITIQSSSNKTYEEEKVLELVIGDNTVRKEHVFVSTARPDEEKPVIQSVEQEGKDPRTIVVTFSEDVSRADNKNNYSILRNGKQVYTVSEATYTAADEKYQAKLILNDNLQKGDYEISVVNVTDNTNEENELTESWSGELDGEGALKAFYSKLGKFWAIILAIAVFAIIAVIYYVIKKHNGIMVVEDEMVLGSNMGKKQHIKHDDSATKEVVFLVSGIASEVRKMNVQINGSAIIGRSSICDVYFDDLSMSKQHFALEVEEGELYLTDLNSRNGTMIDGREAHTKERIHNGSVIEAGSVRIEIRW